MAKFCGNCGAQMEDYAMVCGNCGAPLEMIPGQGMPARPVPGYVDPMRKEKTKKFIKLVGICAGALAAVIVAIVILVNFTGYKGAVRKLMNAYVTEDADTAYGMVSSLGEEFMDEDDLEYSMSSTMKTFDEEFDYSDYKVSWEIRDSATLSDRQMKRLSEGYSLLSELLEEELGSIDQIRKVNVTITAKKGSKTKVQRLDLYLVKESGSWKLLYIERDY